jgi:hypothetical protein
MADNRHVGRYAVTWSQATHDGLMLKSTIGSATKCTAHSVGSCIRKKYTYGVSFVYWDVTDAVIQHPFFLFGVLTG